jgi:hypothetical protein
VYLLVELVELPEEGEEWERAALSSSMEPK